MTDSGETERCRVARALLINAAMVRAFMIRERLQENDVPDVAWFSPQEAEDASVMMRDLGLGRRENADGSTTVSCFVEPTRVRSLYIWALAEWADTGRGAT
jgi:hypothetical protein